jgi:pimeloyl-ACP methyl ester carboxylesterase
MTTHHTVEVDGLNVFYRQAGDPAKPKMLLLGGFPASSHQFRDLIPALAERFHVVSTDYPGFGNTDMPDPTEWDYTFDHLTEIVEGLLEEIRFTGPMGIYMQDYGGPIGNRIIARHPDWLEWQVIPERQHLRRGLHRGLGRHPSRAVGEPLPRDRGAARGLSATRHCRVDLHDRPPRPDQDQPRQLEHGPVFPRATERTQGPARSVLRLPHERRALPRLASIPTRHAPAHADPLGPRRHLLHP